MRTQIEKMDRETQAIRGRRQVDMSRTNGFSDRRDRLEHHRGRETAIQQERGEAHAEETRRIREHHER